MKADFYKRYTSIVMRPNKDTDKRIKYDEQYFNKIILKHLPDDSESVILDIGCGYGRFMTVLQNKYKNVYGIDISEEQIEYAKNKLGLTNIELVEPMQFLEKKIDSYDVILLLDVLEHLELNYSMQLLKRIYDSLKKKGVLILQVPNGLTPISVHYGDITHQRAHTTTSIEQCLMMSGFADIKHYPLPTVVHSWKSLLRRILWSYLINPLISAYMLVVYSDLRGGIYTPNLLTIAKK